MRTIFILIAIFLSTNIFAESNLYNPKLESDHYFSNKVYKKESLIYYAEKWAKEFSLNILTVKAVIEQESQWETTATSSVGAKGLMQVMEDTALFLNKSTDESLYNPYTNIYYGCKYLRRLLDRYDEDYFYALVGYYAGPGNSDKLKKNKLKDDAYITKIKNYAYSVLKKSLRYTEVSVNGIKEIQASKVQESSRRTIPISSI